MVDPRVIRQLVQLEEDPMYALTRIVLRGRVRHRIEIRLLRALDRASMIEIMLDQRILELDPTFFVRKELWHQRHEALLEKWPVIPW